MRIGIKGNTLIESLVLSAGMVPEMSFTPFMSCIVSQAVTTAQRVGIFDALQDPESKLTAAQVAAKIEGDPHGVQVLLEALTGFGYLQRDGIDEKFALSPKLRKELQGSQPASFFKFSGDVAKRFQSLEDFIKTGQVENFHTNPITPGSLDNYNSFLVGYSGEATKDIVRRIKFKKTPTKMLDVAGGPAQYSIAFCQKYPDLTSTILELPAGQEAGSVHVAEAKLQDRISYVVGDFFQTSWKADDYDVALLSHIMHCMTAKQGPELLAKAYQHIQPGGMIIVNEPNFQGPKEEIDYMAGWTLLLYFSMMGTRTYPTPTIQQWLSDAGFENVSTSYFRTSAITVGYRK